MNNQQPRIEGESEVDLLAVRLSQFRVELSSQPQSAETAAIDIARVVSPAYVDNDAFLLLFFRADNYDPKRAIERLKSHFRKKLELFGPQRLGNPTTLADLNSDDKVSLLSAGSVLLPDKDSQGRLILVTRYRMMKFSETANMSRAFWFLMMTVLEAGLVQNDGIIWIVVDDESADPTETKVEEPAVLAELAGCAMSLPMRVAALHFCTTLRNEGPTTRDLLTGLIASSNNIQTQLHSGSPLTWIQHLVSAGIPVQGIVPLLDKNVPVVDGQTSGAVVAHSNPLLGSLDGGRKRSAGGEALGPISKVQRTENTTTSIKHQFAPVTEAPDVRGHPSDKLKPSPGVLTGADCLPTCLSENNDSQGISVNPTHFSRPQVKQHMGQNYMHLQPSLGVSMPQPGMIPTASDPTPPGTTSLTPFPQNTHPDRNGQRLPMRANNVKARHPRSAADVSSSFLLGTLHSGTLHSQNSGAMRMLLNPATIAHMLGNTHRMQLPHIGGHNSQGGHSSQGHSNQVSDLQKPPASTVMTMQSGTNTGTTSLQQPQALNGHIPIKPTHRSSRPPLPLYFKRDDATLSAYQCLVRQQIEMFEATQDDVQFNISKMSKTIVLGQVGIRCRHCSILPQYSRPKAAVYYPRTLDSLYQFGQNMVKNHLCVTCRSIPQDTKNTLITLQEERRRGKGGRERWAQAAREMGVLEDQHGLRFG